MFGDLYGWHIRAPAASLNLVCFARTQFERGKPVSRIRIVPIAIIIAVVCLGPGALIRWKIEQAVSAKLGGMLGAAKSYSVHVSGGLFEMLGGKIKQIDINGKNVKLSNGVVVDRLDVLLSGVHVKPDQTVTGVDTTAFTAVLSEPNLNDYLRASRSDMRDANITLTDGKLLLTAKPRVLAMKTPVSLEGSMQIVRGTRLDMVLSKLSAHGIRVPGFIRGKIQHDINPVLDTEQMGMGARLSKVAIQDGQIALTGTADVKQALVAK